jgi:NADH:ubiquinone oxidoreductase subunit 6 (subunit J)
MIYVGAIVVLFLFIIMFLDLKIVYEISNWSKKLKIYYNYMLLQMILLFVYIQIYSCNVIYYYSFIYQKLIYFFYYFVEFFNF